MGADYRLLVVSSRARNKVAIFNSVLPNLVLVDYNYEMTTLDELLSVWFSKKYLCSKGFSFLYQCFAQLRFWKSVSDSQNLLAGATAVLLETLFQNRSCAKH